MKLINIEPWFINDVDLASVTFASVCNFFTKGK
jgi:hypothetical protein